MYLSSQLRIRLIVERIPRRLWLVLYLPQVGNPYQVAVRIAHNKGCQQCLNERQTLIRLTRKGIVKLDWTREHEEAFQEVKQMLRTAPMLRPPDMSKEFFYLSMLVLEGLGHCWNKKGRTRGGTPSLM